MSLGAFSISLNVKDLTISRDFYSKLGFHEMGGNADHGYLIMKNGSNIVGLFAGFIKSNTLTFNPGWDQNAQPVEDFEDVRAIQKRLKSEGIKLTIECDEATTGPAHLTLVDPYGNAILIDQHV